MVNRRASTQHPCPQAGHVNFDIVYPFEGKILKHRALLELADGDTIMYESVIDGDAAIAHLYELCEIEENTGRGEYMREHFEALGLTTEVTPISWYSSEDENVFADYRGDPDSDQYLVVCAHHDTVSNSPGANDNGSGSVMLLELADALVRNEAKINIRFASFGLEEKGLIGARKYAADLSEEEKSYIKGAVNLDCIGNGSDLVIITKDYYARTTPWINEEIEKTADSMGIVYQERSIGFGASDQAALIKAGIDATFICRMEGHSIPDIHSPNDKPENNNADQLAEVGDLTYNALFNIYNAEPRAIEEKEDAPEATPPEGRFQRSQDWPILL